MSGEALIDVRGLRGGYGKTPILQGIDLAVKRGEIVGVIGRNGVGKTTMMRCLIGLIAAAAGTIRFKDRDITRTTADQRAQLGIGYIPQGRDVFPRMTVEENLRVGELIGRDKPEKLHELVYEFFPILKVRRRQRAGTLSGGEQQQLAIGRALIGNPDLMLLDEPSEGIQPTIVADISNVMTRINRDLGTTILFVEQNLDMIMAMTRRCYVMDKGRIIAEIQPEQLADREVIKRYLQI